MRDIDSDKDVGKETLAVKLGKQKSKLYHIILIISAIVISCLFSILYYSKPTIFLFYLAYIPLIIHINVVRKATSAKDYDPQLKVLALTTFAFALLLGISYIL